MNKFGSHLFSGGCEDAIRVIRRHPEVHSIALSRGGYVWIWAVNLYASIIETGTPTPDRDFISILKKMARAARREEKAKLRATSSANQSAASSQPPETLP